jgi:F0F1-type ATP synthase assembly protein I
MKKISLSSIQIFWSEMAAFILVYAAYALIVVGIALYLEHRTLGPSTGFQKLLISNSAILVLAVLLFGLNQFITGWLHDWFGGEAGSFFITLAISYALIHWLQIHFVRQFGFGFESPHLVSGAISLMLQLPYIVFYKY